MHNYTRRYILANQSSLELSKTQRDVSGTCIVSLQGRYKVAQRRCSRLQGKVANLLNYEPPSPLPQDYKDLEARVAFLSEACGVNAPLLNQVKRLGRLVNPVK